MNIRLVKNGGDYETSADYFDLPGNIKFNRVPFMRRWSMQDRATQSGGVILGDGTIKPFKLQISGILHPTQTINSYIGELKSFCQYNAPLRAYVIGNTEDDQFFWQDIELEEVTRTGIIYNDIEEINIVLLVPNPFEYAETETTETYSGVENGDTITIDVSGWFEVYPEITFTNVGTGINGSFKLQNNTDNFLQLEVNDPTFAVSDDIIVDNYSGTIEKSGINIIEYLNTSFIRLLPGENELIYTGQEDMDIEIKYRELR